MGTGGPSPAGPRICPKAGTHQSPEKKPGAFLPVHITRSKRNIHGHVTSDYAETRVSETLELAVTQHKLQLLPQFSLAPHFNLLSGCEKAVGSHSRVHGRNPLHSASPSPSPGLGFQPVGTGTAPLVLAELRWFASPEDPPPGAGCCLHLPGECISFWQAIGARQRTAFSVQSLVPTAIIGGDNVIH